MRRYLIIFLSLFVVSVTHGAAQTKKTPTETSDPSYVPYSFDQLMPGEAKWKKYKTNCKPCRGLVKTYNQAMQDLLDARAVAENLDDKRYESQSDDGAIGQVKQNTTGEGLSEGLDRSAAILLDIRMREQELFNAIPAAKARVRRLEILTNDLIKKIAECEKQCKVPEEENIIGSLGGKTPITKPDYVKPEDKIPEDTKPDLPFDWKGPYPEVCEACRKLAARLNELPDIAIQIMTELEGLKARQESLRLKIKIIESGAFQYDENDERAKKWNNQARKDIKKLNSEIKKLDKPIKRVTSNLEKVKKNFADTLVLYNDCVANKCPPRKNACVFPNSNGYDSILIGPNDQYGSSAQAAKEMRDRATGAVKGAATKALGSLLGFGGGGGGSSGPKTDRDRSKGDFVRISSGGTDLDMRASWRNDELIVSTEIDDTEGDGTFHAQWIEDIDGNIYLPTRYLIFKMYRDWKLTVSWTEDHYVDGEHVFHDEGQEITTGRDLLGSWTLFEGENVATNSVWGMLGFDTAAKGVRHLGAVYDLPPSAFSENCQMRLINHISQPDNDPVTTIPIVGDLFKHLDTKKRKPETIILIQPHLVDVPEG